MTYLYIEHTNGGVVGSGGPPGDNAWTDESDWREIADGTLRVIRFDGEKCEELTVDGTWIPVKDWYRT